MTRNDAHTPGPWTCRPTEDGAYALNPSGVGWLRCSKDETWANAHLIATAPELLDVLKRLVGLMNEDLDDEQCNAWDAAVALIAKAEGR